MRAVVRPYEARDSDRYWYVRDVAFRGTHPTEPENRVFRTQDPFVAELEGNVVGVFGILDLPCTRESHGQLRCAGIAGVAVDPAFRHLGIGSEMMRWSVRHMRDQGYQIASLYAFRESFYRKFGYEVCGKRFELEAPSHRLPKIEPSLPVQTLDWQDHSKIQACHEAFSRRYSGASIRDDLLWSRILNDKKAILAVGDPVEAYAIVEHSNEFWTPQWINELAWSSWEGYKSILAVLARLCINKSALKWTEPSDSPYLQLFADANVTACDYRRIMYRLLDVPGSIRSLQNLPPGSFSFEVEDELVPENRGPWRVESDGQTVTCEPVESADIFGTIQTWTQAFLGDPGIDRSPMIEREAGGLARAAQVLPRSIVHCQEFF